MFLLNFLYKKAVRKELDYTNTGLVKKSIRIRKQPPEIFPEGIHKAYALKLYMGLIISTMSTDSFITSMMSSKDLYAMGASSRVNSLTEVV